jgi:hypothetical protein
MSVNNREKAESEAPPCGFEQRIDSTHSNIRLSRMEASQAPSYRILDMLEGQFSGQCTALEDGPNAPAKVCFHRTSQHCPSRKPHARANPHLR